MKNGRIGGLKFFRTEQVHGLLVAKKQLSNFLCHCPSLFSQIYFFLIFLFFLSLSDHALCFHSYLSHPIINVFPGV